jgi:beta-glucosidase
MNARTRSRRRGLLAIAAAVPLTLSAAGIAAADTVAAPTTKTAETAELPWMDTSLTPQQRSDLLVDALTLEQKVQQLHGSSAPTPELLPECNGTNSSGGYGTFRNVTGIPQLGIPTFRITNGPVGVGYGDCTPQEPATALPVALALAAGFDPDLAYQFGDLAGQESRTLGLHEFEAPGINLARIANGGRNFEYFGEDPYLSGVIAAAEVKGVQDNDVIAMAKHYVLNDQEKDRGNVSVEVDESVLHELYLLPFEMAVKDGDLGSIMCSYNKIDGVYSCENDYTLTTVLRDMWDFEGYVQSDFGATHSTAPSLNAGMDLEMQSGRYMTLANIQAALDDGSLRMSTIDQALDRRYTQMFKYGIFDRPITRAPISPENGQVAREIGEQTSVLLKNDDDFLPLDPQVGTIALIGQSTYVDEAVAGGGGSSRVVPTYTVDALEGLENALAELGSDATVNKVTVAKDLSNLDAAVAAASEADVVVVMAGLVTAEGRDQLTADNQPILNLPDNQDALISAVAEANASTAVVLKDGDPVLMPWLDQVPSVLEAWNPGQEDGNVVANLLLGLANPSGKLPVTYPASVDETPTAGNEAAYPGLDLDGVRNSRGNLTVDVVRYEEGREMGYRWYDANDVEPQFAFGHGLSYTDFEISKLTVTPKVQDGTKAINVQFFVENTGDVAGAEVPQVYLGLPESADQPPKRLVGFDKVELEPGEKQHVTITIDPAASNHPLSVWDAEADEWTTPDGEFDVYVGNSSDNITLQETITVRTPSGR